MAVKDEKAKAAPAEPQTAARQSQKRMLKIKLVRSVIGRPRTQREVVKGLGLRKLNSEVIREDRPEIRGMVNKISHLLKVEAIDIK